MKQTSNTEKVAEAYAAMAAKLDHRPTEQQLGGQLASKQAHSIRALVYATEAVRSIGEGQDYTAWKLMSMAIRDMLSNSRDRKLRSEVRRVRTKR